MMESTHRNKNFEKLKSYLPSMFHTPWSLKSVQCKRNWIIPGLGWCTHHTIILKLSSCLKLPFHSIVGPVLTFFMVSHQEQCPECLSENTKLEFETEMSKFVLMLFSICPWLHSPVFVYFFFHYTKRDTSTWFYWVSINLFIRPSSVSDCRESRITSAVAMLTDSSHFPPCLYQISVSFNCWSSSQKMRANSIYFHWING